MHEAWTDKLSDYVDDDLSARERAAVERHLAGCASCTAVLQDLKTVVARAGSLEVRRPDHDLWPAIASALTPARRASWSTRLGEQWAARLTFSVPQAVAASVAIALLSAAAVWPLALRWSKRSVPAPVAVTGTAATPPASRDGSGPGDRLAAAPATVMPAAAVSFADAQYDAAVADLERALDRGRGRLDRTTVAIVERNLQIIDQAIDQARQALEADPANEYLSGHLVEARRRKLDLLRRAAALADTN